MPNTPQDPPLVDLKVTNPVTYIKKWWSKIIGNEGIDFRFHVRPLTALALAVVVASIGFGVGRFVLPFSIPFFQYNYETGEVDKINPSPTTNPLIETAYTGTLQFSYATSLFYLQITSSSQAITLEVPVNLNLETLVGKRILAIGTYNKQTRTLVVSDAKDLEVLPKSPVPIPTIEPTLTPSPTPDEPIQYPPLI